MKKKLALEIIRTEVAKHGKITQKAMLTYVENRISKSLFDETVNDGIETYNRTTKASN